MKIMKDKESLCGIYCIMCQTNKKVYIGQTTASLIGRWNNHRYRLLNNEHYNTHLQYDWNIHGEDNFNIYMLQYCEKEDIDAWEVLWIDLYNSLDREYGYNLSSGGRKGCTYLDETKQKIINATTGENNANFGKPRTEKTKSKISSSQSGDKGFWFGKHHSDNTKLKITNTLIGTKRKDNTSGYIGVYWNKLKNKWFSQLRVNKRNKCVGYFADKIEAAKAYDKASWEVYHCQDKLNFPEDYQCKVGEL